MIYLFPIQPNQQERYERNIGKYPIQTDGKISLGVPQYVTNNVSNTDISDLSTDAVE